MWCVWIRSFRWNHQSWKIPFQSKVMMKNLLKITEIAMLSKCAYIPSYQKYIDPKCYSTNWNLNKACVKISCHYLSYFSRNKLSNSDAVGWGQFIVLNNSASPKMDINIHFNYFRFENCEFVWHIFWRKICKHRAYLLLIKKD